MKINFFGFIVPSYCFGVIHFYCIVDIINNYDLLIGYSELFWFGDSFSINCPVKLNKNMVIGGKNTTELEFF